MTVYTDRFAPEALPDEVGVVALGKPRENVAITRAARLVTADGAAGEDDVFVTVTNYAGRMRSASIVVLGQAGTVAEKDLRLEPGAREHLSFRLPAGVDVVEVQLDGDEFPLDDVARLAPAPRRELALFTDLAEEGRKRLGLERAPETPLAQWLALVPRSRRAEDADSAHLVISTSAPEAPGAWCLQLVEAEGEPLDLIGPFLIEKRHPAADGVLLDGVVWSAVAGVELPGVPILSAGNLPLLTELDLGDRRVYPMNIDWARSTLQRSPDWPILLANLAELRRNQLDGPVQTNLGVGEVFVYRSREAADYELSGPDGVRELRAVSTLEIDDLRLPGDYVLSSAGEERARFAVHFADDAESDLRRASAGERPSTIELGEERSGSSWVVLLLALGALGAALVDWWVLRPRGPATFEPGGTA